MPVRIGDRVQAATADGWTEAKVEWLLHLSPQRLPAAIVTTADGRRDVVPLVNLRRVTPSPGTATR